MRVAVCADMEGLSGVDRYQQCFPGWTAEYRHGVRMLVGDVGAAVEAALSAGADDVGIADWHYLGRNVPAAAFPDLPIGRLWRRGRPAISAESLGRPDAAIFVGIHAGAGSAEGFLSHTFWMGMSVAIDGLPVSESVLWALALGAEGVPVAAVAGDSRAVEEAAELLPGIPSVGVKAGTSRTSAILRAPQDAREEIAETVRDSLAHLPDPRTHPFPAEVTIRFADRANAARAADRGVAERTGPRDVSARLGSAHDLMPFLARALLATPLGTGPAVANRLLPRRTGALARLQSVALDPLLGWLERRVVSEWAREPAELYPEVGGGGGVAGGGGGGAIRVSSARANSAMPLPISPTIAPAIARYSPMPAETASWPAASTGISSSSPSRSMIDTTVIRPATITPIAPTIRRTPAARIVRITIPRTSSTRPDPR